MMIDDSPSKLDRLAGETRLTVHRLFDTATQQDQTPFLPSDGCFGVLLPNRAIEPPPQSLKTFDPTGSYNLEQQDSPFLVIHLL
jgi:hypothetical protein